MRPKRKPAQSPPRPRSVASHIATRGRASGEVRLSRRGFHAPAGARRQRHERESIRVAAQLHGKPGRGGRWKPHAKSGRLLQGGPLPSRDA